MDKRGIWALPGVLSTAPEARSAPGAVDRIFGKRRLGEACTAKAPQLISGAMDEIATPHDTFFRENFGRREIAEDFLRHHLPTELLAEIDLATLEISKDTYVSADLRSAYSDLVYRVRHRDGPLTILESLLRYYVQGTGRVEEHDVRALLEQTPTGDPIMQTFIDRYIEQGRQQGIEQGIARGRQEGWQEGRQEGRQEGEAAILLRQIDRKFGPPSELVRKRISSADPETLLRWSDRILTADSLDAVLH
jgi:hypothetical protein